MKRGEILALDNTRHLAADVYDRTGAVVNPSLFAGLPASFTRILGGLADYMVNDGFSVSHRWHGSVVGFPSIPNIAGRFMEEEIGTNRTMSTNTPHPYTMVFGGVKIIDYLGLVKESLDAGIVDTVLATGALGIIGVLGILGRDNLNYLGAKTVEFLKEKGIYNQLDTVTGLARRYPNKFVLPIDFKVELDGQVYEMTPDEINNHQDKDRMHLWGIGHYTVEMYKTILGESRTAYIKGPPTLHSDPRFFPESKDIVDTLVALTKGGATTILSGGDTDDLVKKSGYIPKDAFMHRTLAGGASTEFRAGKLLPGLFALNVTYNAVNGLPLNSGLGSYPIGFDPVAPRIPTLLRR